MTTPDAIESALDDIEMAATYQPDHDVTMPFSVELLAAVAVLRQALVDKNATIERLRAALKTFAKTAGQYDNEPDEMRFVRVIFSVYDLRRARAALGEQE